MNKVSQVVIIFAMTVCLGSAIQLVCFPRPMRLLSVLMAAVATKQAEESISSRMERIKRAEEEEKLKAALKVAPSIAKAMQSEQERELKETSELPAHKNKDEGREFDEFQKRHPSYMPVLFPLSRGGPGYMGCDLDFNLGSRFSQILIQPGLRALAFERGFGKNTQDNTDSIKLSGEAYALLGELRKNSPIEGRSEYDMTTEVDARHGVTDDIVSVASKIPTPHLCTETFVHKQAVKDLEQQFPGAIKCTLDRCIVGNKRHTPPGLGIMGKDLPQAGRWFGPTRSSDSQEEISPKQNSGRFSGLFSWLRVRGHR